jgi:hypothetical protein
VNVVIKNRIAWLAYIQAQLVANLGEAQKQYKENVDEHHKNQPNFKDGNQVWF